MPKTPTILLAAAVLALASCGSSNEQTEPQQPTADTTAHVNNSHLANDGTHVIEGTILNAPLRRVTLQEVIPPADPKLPPKVSVLGSANLDGEGNFRLEVQLTEPMLATLLVDQGHAVELVLQGGETVLLADYSNWSAAEVSVDKRSKELHGFLSRFKKLSDEFQETQQRLMVGLRNPDAEEKLQTLLSDIETLVKGYMDSTSCIGCAMYASRILDPSQNFDYLNAFRDNLASEWPNSHYIAELEERLVPLSKWIGQLAPDFTLPNRDGQQVSLSSARGKYVLLDFWAAWCGPCRRENPNIVRLYNKYKNQGLTVFSVSLDGQRQQQNPRVEWLAAINADKLSWPNHVSDLKGWQSPVVSLYEIVGIPKSFLLDQEGRIIAMDLRGKVLERALDELFTNG